MKYQLIPLETKVLFSHFNTHSFKLSNKVCFLSVRGFFDHQYLWKETINVLDNLHKNKYQGKIAYKTTTVC